MLDIHYVLAAAVARTQVGFGVFFFFVLTHGFCFLLAAGCLLVLLAAADCWLAGCFRVLAAPACRWFAAFFVACSISTK